MAVRALVELGVCALQQEVCVLQYKYTRAYIHTNKKNKNKSSIVRIFLKKNMYTTTF
jgi:hypothetical protein